MKQRSVFSFLAFSTISSFAIAAASVLVLEPHDRISISRGSCLLILGFIFFLSLFYFINHLALKTTPGFRLRKKYQLTVGDVLDISNKLVSAIQAVLSCISGAIVCLWSCTRDFLHSSHFMSEAYAWFGAAYFFYDIWSMYKVHIHMCGHNTGQPSPPLIEKPGNKVDVAKTNGNGTCINVECKKKSNVTDTMGGDFGVCKNERSLSKTPSFFSYCKDQPVIIMHHLFIGGFGFLVIVYLRKGLGDCVFGFVYLMEASTPFVSFRGILSQMKLKSTNAYVWNGILMLLTFFVYRILVMPYLIYWYSTIVGLPILDSIRNLPTGCQISIMILMLPQIYWFYLMVLGAYKVFFPKNVLKKPTTINDNGNNLNETLMQKNIPQAKQSSVVSNGDGKPVSS